MTNRLGQSAIQATTVAGVRETSAVVSSTAVKYNPGWGVHDAFGVADANTTLVSGGDIPSVIDEIRLMPNVVTFAHDFLWGCLETAQNDYQNGFDLIDSILGLCQTAGKRLVIIMQWSAISGANVDYQVSQGRFPAYLRDNGWLVANGVDRVDPKLYLPQVMDRWLALNQAYATRYNSHAWFEGIQTYDSTLGALIASDSSYTPAAIKTQFIRMMQQKKIIWPNTNCFIALDGTFGLSVAERQDIFDAARDNRMVVSNIDVMPKDFLASAGGTGGRLMQKVYQGITGTHDYRNEMAYGGRTSSNNVGGNGCPTAAQFAPTSLLNNLFYPSVAVNLSTGWYLNSSWHFLCRKTVGVSSDPGGFTNDQFWNTAAAGYTLYHPTLKEFLNQSAGSIALRTTKPPNYTSVVTGGT